MKRHSYRVPVFAQYTEDGDAIIVIQTGKTFASESEQFVVIYPHDKTEVLWSAPLFDFRTIDQKLEGALDFAVEKWKKEQIAPELNG